MTIEGGSDRWVKRGQIADVPVVPQDARLPTHEGRDRRSPPGLVRRRGIKERGNLRRQPKAGMRVVASDVLAISEEFGD